MSSLTGEDLAAITPLDLSVQTAVLLIAVLAAFLVRSRWNRAIDSRVNDSEPR